MRWLLALAALLLAGASSAWAAGLPSIPSGSVVGEGTPLKAYTTLTPTVHLFGDAVTAQVAIVADRKWVDPARLRVHTDFRPYRPQGAPRVLSFTVGRFSQVTWTWNLSCLTAPCVPRAPPSEKYHVFHFSLVHIYYLDAKARRPLYETTASWPALEVLSQVSPSVETALVNSRGLEWQYRLAPVSSPTYRVSPELLYWLALGLGGLLLIGAAGLAHRWYRTLRPRLVTGVVGAAETRSALERALALLAWAHERGEETLQRKAFERVAGELGTDVDELTRTARELAWSRRTPDDEEVESFAEQVRGSEQPAEEETEAP